MRTLGSRRPSRPSGRYLIESSNIFFKNCSQLVSLEGVAQKDGRALVPSDLSILEGGGLIFHEQEILWVGLGHPPSHIPIHRTFDLSGKVVAPAIVDSHTHLVFGGSRAHEHSARLNGDSYESIALAGGGIMATARATRQCSSQELVDQGLRRLDRMRRQGVGTVEIKSGYGGDFDSEKRISLVIDQLKAQARGVEVFRTFMAPHACPPEFASTRDYMDQVALPLLDELVQRGAVDGVDIFVEEGYFTQDDARRLFQRARKHGLAIKIHADEFCDSGGAQLAMDFGAVSADHLIKVNPQAQARLGTSDTTATLLPGTGLFLGKDLAPYRELQRAKARIAFASDFNPGSNHWSHLLQIVSLVAPSMGVSVPHLWAGITYNAARALGKKRQGALLPGWAGRVSVFDCSSIDEITYNPGHNFAVIPPHLA